MNQRVTWLHSLHYNCATVLHFVQDQNEVSQLIGDTELKSEVQQLIVTIKTKDSELQTTAQQLQEEQTKKKELEQEIALLRETLSTVDVEGISYEQSKQKLMQQMFLKERERHYLSLVGSGYQHIEKNTHGNELDLILVEKDMEINRMRKELTEIEERFSREKNRAEELKSELVSVTSVLAVKNAHIEEIEKAKEELSKYLADERHRVDMLLMKVQVPPPIINSLQLQNESPVSTSPTPSPKCCVVSQQHV